MSENCNQECSGCKVNDCSSRRTTETTVLEGVKIKQIIAVTSGKGGVGKSMVTGLMATELKRKGYKVGIIDADITGPSIPKMFNVTTRIYGDGKGMYPCTTSTGIKIVSVNLLLENESDPVLWRGSLITQMLNQFYNQVYWGELDFLLIDMPPGTGDIALTVYQSLPVNQIVIVASPQDLVAMIVSKACKMAEMMNLKVAGIVENMSYLVCPCCTEKINIFNDSHVDEVAATFNLPVLSRIPLDQSLAKLADDGCIEANHVDYGKEILDKLL